MANICSSPWQESCPLLWHLHPCGCGEEDCDYNLNQPIGPTMNSRLVRKIEEHFSRRIFLHASSLEDLVFDGDIKGASPLLLACKQGDLEVVKHIIESWRVDFQASAIFHLLPFSEIITIKATPLFVAALYGHSNIVRYLVDKGANVNVEAFDPPNESSYDQWTPLDAAFMKLYSTGLPNNPERRQDLSSTVCFLLQHGATLPYRLRLPNGESLWMNRSCDADLLNTLLDRGMDVNIRHNGSSLLHYWASVYELTPNDPRILAVVQLLVGKGADLMARNKHGHTPIHVAAGGDPCNHNVLDFLLERKEIDRVEKIVALELAGAVLLTARTNVVSPDSRNRALGFWRRRDEHSSSENWTPKILS